MLQLVLFLLVALQALTLPKSYSGMLFAKLIAENPLTSGTPEYTYAQGFSSLGLGPTACTTLSASLNATIGSTGQGWTYLQSQVKITGNVTNFGAAGKWYSLPSTGTWGSDYLTRAVTSHRLFAMNANNDAIYWTSWTDSAGNALTGASNYSMVFNPTGLTNTATNGFWSITLYDASWYMISTSSLDNARVRGAASATTAITVVIRKSCGTVANCLVSPATGGFNVMLRGYQPNASYLPGGFTGPVLNKV